MLIYLFRLMWALLFFILTIILDLILLIISFKYLFGIQVDTRDKTFFKPINTLGEHGLWKSMFHWALKIEKKY